MTGPNILVVEDEYLLACTLEEDLQRHGYVVIGPFGDLQTATAAARRKTFDLAILDINLRGELVYPLADDLAARAVPFIFLTGYSTLTLPERLRASPRLAKPYDPADLLREIKRVLNRPR
jgi:DNA-binding response OmpR family regulator